MKLKDIIKCFTEKCINTFHRTNSCHKYCKECIKKRNSESRKRWQNRQRDKDPSGNRRYHRVRARKHRFVTKEAILTHYGKGGELLCSWRGCLISDIDMLSLDHINNNGKEDRTPEVTGGYKLYRKVIVLGYPKGFQTLCFNHQFKKEFLRKRKI